MTFGRATCLFLAAPALALSGCGGGSGGTAVTSIPPPPPVAPPPAGPAAELVTPVQTADPPIVFASGSTPTLPNGGTGTVFPLLQTVVTEGFAGDAVSTNAGATLTLGASGYTLTLNNPNLGIVNAPENKFTSNNAWTGERVIDVSNLDYTAYGFWTQGTTVGGFKDLAGGVFLGGYVTPPANIPLSGSATYSGVTTGLHRSAGWYSTDMIEFWGSVGIQVDFSSRSLVGSITNITFTEDAYQTNPFAIGFNATWGSGQSMFSGTTRVTTPSPTTFFGMPSGSTGTISGSFFGPSAQELGAVWTLSGGNSRMIGTLGARTNP